MLHRTCSRNHDEDPLEPVPFLQTPYNEGAPQISPDARYVAYVSDQSGRNEVYVSEFPGGGDRVAVSVDGGLYPRWSPRGRRDLLPRGPPAHDGRGAHEPDVVCGSPATSGTRVPPLLSPSSQSGDLQHPALFDFIMRVKVFSTGPS